MQFKRLIIFAYAITAAGLAAGFASTYARTVEAYYLSTYKAPAVEKAPAIMIVTATKALKAGHKLSRDEFELVPWPAGALPLGAYRDLDKIFAGEQAPHLKADLVAGEVVLQNKIDTAAVGSPLAMMLPPGMRAVTIQVNEVLGVGGFVRPNDAVDILLTELPADAAARASRVILQNVKVLAMGQDISASRTTAIVANSATVAVTLEGAQKLALATTMGKISLALRNPQQKSDDRERAVSTKDLRPTEDAVAKVTGKMEVVVHRAATDDSGQLARQVFRYGTN